MIEGWADTGITHRYFGISIIQSFVATSYLLLNLFYSSWLCYPGDDEGKACKEIMIGRGRMAASLHS